MHPSQSMPSSSITTAIGLYDDSEAASNLGKLIGDGFKLRQEAEHRHATTIPRLERHFPVLSLLLKCCGLLRSERGIFRNPLPWSILMVVVHVTPYILSSVLPRCAVSCKYADTQRCGMCTATLSDSAVNGYHTVAFSMLALLLSKNLAWTLHDTTSACKVQHEVDRLRLRYTLGSFAISIVWWALVPLIGLSFPGFVSMGDVIVGVSALIRAPFAATLSAAVLGSLTLIMATLTLEMKGIRAASKVGQTEHMSGSGDMLRRQLRYTATLHAAYHHANMLTQQAAVNIQVNILAFFCLAINSSLACLFVVFTGTWDENPDYATLLMIGNTVAINVFALVLCGFAAHITSITDSTIRSVQNQFSFAVANIFSKEHTNTFKSKNQNKNQKNSNGFRTAPLHVGTTGVGTGMMTMRNRNTQQQMSPSESQTIHGAGIRATSSARADPVTHGGTGGTKRTAEESMSNPSNKQVDASDAVVRDGVERAMMLQEIGVLNDLLSYAKEAGGFRLLGQRISYSFFLIAFTALLGVANIFVSRIKQQK